jgi:hypothetical protein
MKESDFFRLLETDSQLLEKISQQYQPDSAEFEAVRRAALALAYVVMNRRAEFATFIEEMESDLSDAQREELRELYGIDS